EGYYSLELDSPGTFSIQFSSMGYENVTKEVTLSASEKLELSVQLSEALKNLDEIVITSNRRTETLDEVPSSVSVLNSREIENLSLTSNNIADVLVEIPGLALSTNQTSNVGQTLRGRNMLVLIDGIPQSTPLRSGGRDINTIDPNTIQRIEVIKGATAIYGNGADGGIVNYITKDPERFQKLESITQIGTEGSLVDTDHTVGSKISQTFSGTIDNLGYVASGSFRQTGIFRDADGEIISPTYGLGETDQYSLFGKLNYELAEDHSFELMYNFYSSNQDTEYVSQDGIYGKKPAIGVIGEVLGVDQGNRHNHNAQFTYDANNLLGNTDLRLNLYLQDFLTVYGYDGYFINPEAGYDGGQSTVASVKKGVRFNFSTPYSFKNGISGDILYGMDILNDVTSQKLVDGRIWAPEMDMTNFAPYAQLKTLYQDFVLKAGLRFENINIEVPDYSTIHIFPYGSDVSNGGVAVNGGELKYDATTFNVGLRYNKWEIFQPFVSFSQSFSIADLGRTLRTATENTVSNISSEAVIANNYEAGFNSRFGKTSLSGAYFVSTSDLGATYREVNGIFQIARQPEKVYGFELALDTELLENLYFGSSVSYTEGKLDSEDNGNYDTYMNGDRIPPVKTVTYLQYRMWNKWDARLSHIYSGNRDRFEPSPAGTYVYGKGPVNSFNLFNFTTNYQLTKNTKIGLGIENLFNADYYNLLSQWSARDSNYIKGNGARYNLSLTVKL
ncbi:MAG TPA: TonB-dependent receptor, partial [Salinimicrobium sp.]|nr:TonB-dependent receptor [Salinimicrobium sp.]